MIKIRTGTVGRKYGGTGSRRVGGSRAGGWWGEEGRRVLAGGVIVTSAPTPWAPTSRYVKRPMKPDIEPAAHHRSGQDRDHTLSPVRTTTGGGENAT